MYISLTKRTLSKLRSGIILKEIIVKKEVNYWTSGAVLFKIQYDEEGLDLGWLRMDFTEKPIYLRVTLPLRWCYIRTADYYTVSDSFYHPRYIPENQYNMIGIEKKGYGGS